MRCASFFLDTESDMHTPITHPVCRISSYEIAIGNWIAASDEEDTKDRC